MLVPRHPFRAIFAGLALGSLAAACSGSDIVLGERGASDAGMFAVDSGATAPPAGSGGTDSSAAAAASDASSAGASSGTADAGEGPASPTPSAGCGRDPAPSDGRVEAGAVSADYVLDVPAPYDNTRAYPLVMAFRRSDTTPVAFRESLGLTAATGADAIVVYPNCPDGASTWEVQRDLPLIDALLSEIESSHCVDPDRVFAIGLGQGALLVNAFACVRRETWRGFAPLSSVLAPAQGACVGRAAVWLMQGSEEASTMTFGLQNRDYWLERNGCDASASMPVAPSPCVEYAGCDPGYPVRFCEYGAELPSSSASAIWGFFRSL